MNSLGTEADISIELVARYKDLAGLGSLPWGSSAGDGLDWFRRAGWTQRRASSSSRDWNNAL